MRQLLLASVLLAATAALTAQDSRPLGNEHLRLLISAVKPRVLVGEFTRIKTEWLGLRPVVAAVGAENLEIDDGSGFREHEEASYEERSAECTELGPGEPRLSERTVGLRSLREGHSQPLGFVFDKPGTYRVRATYENAASNVIAVEARAPSGREARLLDALRADPSVLTRDVTDGPDRWTRLTALLEQYGGHPYLAPMIGFVYHGADQESFDQRVRVSLRGSVFEPDEELVRANLAPSYYPGTSLESGLRRVIRRFPGRTAAVQAARQLQETATPRADVGLMASWSRQWLAGTGELELASVGAGITVRRGQPAPTVELESITCDDGCNPQTEIADAEVGTRDFQFRLRASSTGARRRTYTITYRVTAANGATTRVSTALQAPLATWIVSRQCG